MEYIRYASNLSVIVPIIMVLTLGGLPKSLSFSLLKYILLASLLSDAISLPLLELQITTYPISNSYVVITFSLFILFYKELLPSKLQSVLNGSLIIFIIFFLVNCLYIQPIIDFQSYTRAFSAAILMVASLSYYHTLLKAQPIDDVSVFSFFWINSGVFFYFSFSFFLFLFGNYVFTNMSPEVGRTYWAFHNLNNIAKNLLFALGIWYAGRSNPVAQ